MAEYEVTKSIISHDMQPKVILGQIIRDGPPIKFFFFKSAIKTDPVGIFEYNLTFYKAKINVFQDQ